MNKIVLSVIALVIIVAGGVWYFSPKTYSLTPLAQQKADSPDNYYSTSTIPTSSTSSTAGSSATTQPQTTTTNTTKIMEATLHTSMGDITIQFDASAPNTAANFIKLAQSGYYDGTKFHRVIKGFMDQAGDPLTKDDSMSARWGTGGPGYQFADENANAHNGVGVVSMANSGPNTNGSQFFINAADNGFLDGKYSVFAKVTAGLDVVMAINNTATDSSDRPLTPVVLKSVTLK